MEPSGIDIDALRKDARRVKAVSDSGLHDSSPDENFDRLTQLAREVTNASIAFLSLIDAGRDFLISTAGFDGPLAGIGELAAPTFCDYSLCSSAPLLIEDVLAHPALREAPSTRLLDVRAYAGIPVLNEDGCQIGSLCIADREPRAWTALQVKTLGELARSVMREIRLKSVLKGSRAGVRRLEIEALHREQLIANIAHDLRAPLQTLHLTFEILTRATTSPERRSRTIEHFNKAFATMTGMLENLLESAPASPSPSKPMPPAGLVNDVLGMMLPIAELRSIQLISYCDRGLPPLSVDYQRVLRVFSNLIGNAIKFSPAGSRIVVDATEQGGQAVRFSIRDAGPGISQEHQQHIFERHWKSDTDSPEGKGLGLSIAREIVEELGGRIGVNSALGQGSEFFFTLPLVERRLMHLAGREE